MMNRVLHDAVCAGDFTGVSNALQNGADPNYTEIIANNGEEPLLFSTHRHTMLNLACRFIPGGNLDIVRALVLHGADLEDGEGEFLGTPLVTLLMIFGGPVNINAVTYLLQSGARVDATDASGSTALHRCGMYGDGRIEVFRLLLAHGANIQIPDMSGNTPLHDACLNADRALQMVQEMVNVHGANILARNNNHQTPYGRARDCFLYQMNNNRLNAQEQADFLFVMGFLLEQYEGTLFQREPRLFLHQLIEDQGSFFQGTSIVLPVGKADYDQGIRFLESLVSRNPAAFNCRDSNGDMPIHLAIRQNVNKETIAFLLGWDKESLLIPDQAGNLPVHIFCNSASTKHLGVLQLMIEQGATATMLCARNNQGLQPLHLLLQNQHQGAECLELVRCMMRSYPPCVGMETRVRDGDLPVYLAAQFASLDVLFELLKAHPEGISPRRVAI